MLPKPELIFTGATSFPLLFPPHQRLFQKEVIRSDLAFLYCHLSLSFDLCCVCFLFLVRTLDQQLLIINHEQPFSCKTDRDSVESEDSTHLTQ